MKTPSRSICIVLVGVLLAASGALFGQTVNFPDANLKESVRACLPNHPPGDITEADMLLLTNLVANGRDIHDLTGLETAPNLLNLQVEWNPITNHTVISALTNLLILSVSANGIPDIGFVAPLTMLQDLNLYSNGIEDISPLAGLVDLRTLVLSRNPVTNYAALSGLTNLVDLSLLGNGVTNLDFIAPLGQLQRLNLDENSVRDISVLAGWTNLLFLNLNWNGVTNPVVLATLTGLQELHLLFNALTNVPYLAGLTNLSGLNLPYTELVDMSPLTNLTRLAWLNVGENSLTGYPDLSPLTNLSVFMTAGNQIADLLPLAKLPTLRNVHLQRNPFADLSPLTNCPLLDTLLLHDNTAITNLPVIASLTNLHWLQIQKMQISDLGLLAPLATLPELWELDLYENRITDLSPLTNYPALSRLLVEVNRLQHIEPLLDMPSLWYVNLCRNVLDTSAGSPAWNVITNLQDRGVSVDYDPQWPLPVPILFLSQPANRSAFVSNNIAFGASVTGGSPSVSGYRWQKDGVDLGDDSRISGTDTETLQINEVTPDDSGFYRVRVWDEWMATNSLAAELKVITNVAFADPNLEQAVRVQVGNLLEPLTPDDLAGMTYLDAFSQNITNLAGLEAAVDLDTLELSGNIAIAGFAPLTFLDALRTIYLNDCSLGDVEELAVLPRLTDLELNRNFIEDLSPLRALVNLGRLWVSDNQLTAIGPLLDLGALYETDLRSNRLDTNAPPVWDVISELTNRNVSVEFSPQNPAPVRPVITVQPNNVAAYPGEGINFHVEATGSGSGLNYRWVKNDINLTDNARIWGTDSDTLHLDDLESGDAGTYRVRIWDENGMTNSRTVTLRVVATIVFVDPQLELAVRDRLGIPTDPITLPDIAMMDWLDAVNYGITNLSGIESAVNLTWLSLRSNREIADFTPLTALWRLTYLELNDCEVADIAFVSDMPPLNELHLWRGNLTDISPLLAQPQLLRLNLAYHTGITNAEVLSTLTSLENLWLEGTGIADISFAGFMPSLLGFSCEADAVWDLTPLSGATNLVWLDMANNQITNAAPLAACTNLEWLSSGNNQIADLGFVTNLRKLGFLAADRNSFHDLSPLAGLTNITWLDVGWNPVTNLTPIASLTRLTDLGVWNLGLSNLVFLASLTSLTNGLSANDNHLSGLPPYPHLKQLRYLNLGHNPLTNINFVAGMTNLWDFHINDDGVANLSPLTGLTNIHNLGVAGNGITDLAPLATLRYLRWVTLWNNHLQDISALSGLTNLDYVDLRHNWLDINPGSAARTVITTLQGRGTTVDYDPQDEAPTPIILSAPTRLGGSQFRFTITSAPGAVLQLWSSTNLSNWSSAGFVTNIAGTTQFTDTAATTLRKFYGAQSQ